MHRDPILILIAFCVVYLVVGLVKLPSQIKEFIHPREEGDRVVNGMLWVTLAGVAGLLWLLISDHG